MVKSVDMVGMPKRPLAMHPQKFAMWLFIVSVVMIFAALTSAYIVRQAEGNWLEFQLPGIFQITTILIVCSSLSLQWAFYSAKKDKLEGVKIGLGLTFVLGLGFLIGQFQAWSDLVQEEVFFVGNPSGSFLYVLTGLHGVHLISALIFLLVVLIFAFKNKVHSQKLVTIEMLATYWHFLGALWLYLYVFLLLYR
ncbi:cytochrome c oxidase subunit 3 [Xanthovirga aplysinae]|uniref:cytochrome c oxidase subunit 3 n=1 Tax=Xanthovirga aplysinae TaxID=2529853 RepID=UPI0012BC86A4|nr:cytochrome c oxidase subunit 3 [Xanthovirga aplysinae]MTI33277.1 cytochrome oxidase subunit III [Xanthovirga aplysinae]